MRKILHMDLDAFFCSVEEILDPSLVGTPFAVGGNPDHRGVISSCSYAARNFSVHSGMPTARALSLCPQLILVNGRHSNYGEYSHKVMAILEDTTPFVQPISIDEAFLDVSDMPESGKRIAQELQKRIKDEVGLPCSIGVATNKLLAKIANDFGKAQIRTGLSPCAITVVPPGTEAAFLAPLPVQSLWGIGEKSAKRLKGVGIFTIGDIAKLSGSQLRQIFGNTSGEIYDRSLGIDESPVHHDRDVKSVSNEITCAKDICDSLQLIEILHDLSEKVGARLRNSNIAGNTIQLKLRYGDFTTITRQMTLSIFTNHDSEIFSAIKTLFETNWDHRTPIRLLGVGVKGLGQPLHQLNLWEQNSLKEQELLKAIDSLKERYGDQIIQRAIHLKLNK